MTDTTTQDYQSDRESAPGAPTLRAVVGSHRIEEEMFGKVFDPQIIRRIGAFVRPYRRQFIISVVAVMVFTLTQLAIPMIIRHAIDKGVMIGNASVLHASLITFAVVILINYGASHIQESVVGRAAENVLFDIRRAMFAHLQRVSLSFMDKTEVGRLMSRLQGDVGSMQEFLETSVLSVGDIILLFGIITIMLYLDPGLGLITLSVMPVLFIARIFWLPLARDAFIKAHETNSAVNGALAEGIHAVRTVQAMGREQLNAQLYDGKVKANLKNQLRGAMLAQVLVPVVDTLTGLAMSLVVVLGGQKVLGHQLDVGVMVAFLFYIQRFFDPIRSLTIQYSVMQRAMASGQRLIEVLDVAITVQDKPGALDMPRSDGSVEFQHVSFGYDPRQLVLRDLSFTVEPGQTVALVGPTGSGKSSAMSLIHRFYDVTDGRVLVGGQDVRDVTQASLGRQIAMVLQEPFLFTGTILENIRYNKTDATREQVIAAATVLGADPFIRALPQGYDTMLGERGGSLSTGQRQLLSFARALVADAPILVLDEATASIDSATEQVIQRALAVLLKGRTGLVIAHRLATVRHADKILVLQAGRLVESGNHAELVAMNGLYAGLYRANYASFDDVERGDLAPAEVSR
jgi:ATP-binding cassette subfamily B multidrug efflux pump